MGSMKRQKAFREPEVLPNAGSDKQTTASLIIDIRYATLRFGERWNYSRFKKLAYALKYTPAELASLVMMPHKMLEDYEKFGFIPSHNKALKNLIGFVLTIVEGNCIQTIAKDTIKNPFPDLNNLKSNLPPEFFNERTDNG